MNTDGSQTKDKLEVDESQIELEIYIFFFLQQCLKHAPEPQIKVKDYYAFLYDYEKTSSSGTKLPSRNTISNNIAKVDNYLEYLHIKNPIFSSNRVPFSSPQSRLFYNQLDTLLFTHNTYKKIENLNMFPEELPLYIGLFNSIGKNANSWKKICEKSLKIAKEISTAISKHHTSKKGILHLSLEPSFLQIIYKYILEYYFSEAMISLFTQFEKYLKVIDFSASEKWNIYLYKQLLLSCNFWTSIGRKYFFQKNLNHFDEEIFSDPPRKNMKEVFAPATIVSFDTLIYEAKRNYDEIIKLERRVYNENIEKTISDLSLKDFKFKIRKRVSQKKQIPHSKLIERENS